MSHTNRSKDAYKATRKGENLSKGKDVNKSKAVERANRKNKDN